MNCVPYAIAVISFLAGCWSVRFSDVEDVADDTRDLLGETKQEEHEDGLAQLERETPDRSKFGELSKRSPTEPDKGGSQGVKSGSPEIDTKNIDAVRQVTLAKRSAFEPEENEQQPTGFSRRVESEQFERHIDNVDNFRGAFEKFNGGIGEATKIGEASPFPGKYKQVLLMVPSKAEAAKERDVVRQTWMNHKNICKAPNGQKEGCVVYVVFATSTYDRKPLDCETNNDCIQVNAAESWLYLYKKSVALFQFALTNYPWATHIGKVDLDTFPFLHVIVPSIPEDRYSVVGSFQKMYKHTIGNYPAGPFYLLSRDLAAGAYSEGTQAQMASEVARHFGGGGRLSEDRHAGLSIKAFKQTAMVHVNESPANGMFIHQSY